MHYKIKLIQVCTYYTESLNSKFCRVTFLYHIIFKVKQCSIIIMMQISSYYQKLINEIDNEKPTDYSTSNSFRSKIMVEN